MKRSILTLTYLLLLVGLQQYAVAQGGSPAYKDGMTLKLDSAGNKYIRFFTWATFWARQTSANPGTALNGIANTNYTDFSLRQFRFLVLSQLSPRYLVLADIGIDNQTFSSGGIPGGGNTGNGGANFSGTLGKKSGLYLHDLWNEYAILPDKDAVTHKEHPFSLYVGTGLHYWNGISRMSSSSSANYLAVDVPLYNWPLVDLSDQFARQIGVYFKGNAGRIAYRWAVNKPFTVLSQATQFTKGAPDSAYAVDNNATGKLSTTGYAAWQFFEKERNQLPFTTGTYVGTMKVLNAGIGYYHTADGTVTQTENTATSALIRHPITVWAADVFADISFGPEKQNWAVTAYSVYYHSNFGPNYLRSGSIINQNVGMAPGYEGKVSQAGFGNAAPVIGTGYSWFTQAGLLLPKTMLRSLLRFQPFGEFSLQEFERYGSSKFTYWSAGSNIYIDGHHARVSIKYQTRPIVVNNTQDGSKWSLIIATQVYL